MQPAEPGGDPCSQRLCVVGRQRWDGRLCWIQTWRRRNSRGRHAGCTCRPVLLPQDGGQRWAPAASSTWGVRGGFAASAGTAALYGELRRSSSSERRSGNPIAVGVTGGLPGHAEFFHRLSFSALDWVAELVHQNQAAQRACCAWGVPGSVGPPWLLSLGRSDWIYNLLRCCKDELTV